MANIGKWALWFATLALTAITLTVMGVVLSQKAELDGLEQRVQARKVMLNGADDDTRLRVCM